MTKYAVIITSCFIFYVGVCILLYFFQEKLIFFPAKLSKDHIFTFHNFEEINFKVEGGITINAVLFTSRQSKGVVFFLHGNAGSIAGWGQGASLYVENGYDVLYLDYRGYGKSAGHIESEKQLIDDAQIVYDYLQKKYSEKKIIVSGTSIGTGIAAKIASRNNPRGLILCSPYYSLKTLIKEKVPIAPAFIIKYSLDTYKFLQKVKCPITILHGSKDEIIPVKHAVDLKKMHPKVDLTIIGGYGHNDLSGSEEYVNKWSTLLR